MIETMVLYAWTFLGVGYHWGGDHRMEGVDCSGYILEVMRGVGLDIGDKTAQGIFDHFYYDSNVIIGEVDYPGRGDLLFFGKNDRKITHIALAYGSGLMLESGGAGRGATLEDSKKTGAGVRLRKIRSDLVGVLNISHKLGEK